MTLLTIDEAKTMLLAAARPVKSSESVPLREALGRVVAEPLVSGIDVPPSDNSAMDGYAVRCADLPMAGLVLPVAQRIPAGTVGGPLAPRTAARIFTGAPVPDGADAIVMQELCVPDEAGVQINHVPKVGDWIRCRGEDIPAGGEMVARGTRLRPQDIGLAASVGMPALSVFRHFRVALLTTGDELVMPGELLPPGAIYNSNHFVLDGLLRRLGCVVTNLGNVPDNLPATRAALQAAARENDLIITSGGVSVGDEDHVKAALQAEGSLDLWRIAVKPGKPLAFGRIADAAFIGLPGNPVSVFVAFALLVRPFILKCQGSCAEEPVALQQVSGFDWPKPDKRREFLRARVGGDGKVELFPNQSAGALTSTVWAQGFVDNPPEQVIRRGDIVRYLPFSELGI